VSRRAGLALGALLLCGGALAQTPPPDKGPVQEVTDLVNALLGGLMGGAEVTGERLQEEVAEAGGLPFRQSVPVDFINRAELGTYLRELFDAEYTEEQARVDERLLRAFDPPRHRPARPRRVLGTTWPATTSGREAAPVRGGDRTFSPMNQVVSPGRAAAPDQYQPWTRSSTTTSRTSTTAASPGPRSRGTPPW
jgi:hypothetical protein